MTGFKVCGVTRAEDGLAAASAGAAAIGVIFAPSPRQVDVEMARHIVAGLPDAVARVGVFVDQPLSLLVDAVTVCDLAWVQLSGEESADFALAVARETGARVLKAVHVIGAEDLARATDYPADAWLLDTPAEDGRRGGTGRQFDWSLLAETGSPQDDAPGPDAGPGTIGGLPASRTVIAGGLHAGNVRTLLARVRPAAVDVCSGVEAVPRIKDPSRIRAFAAAVRTASAVPSGMRGTAEAGFGAAGESLAGARAPGVFA